MTLCILHFSRSKASGSYQIAPAKVTYKGYGDEKKLTGYSAQPSKAIRVMSFIESQMQIFSFMVRAFPSPVSPHYFCRCRVSGMEVVQRKK